MSPSNQSSSPDRVPEEGKHEPILSDALDEDLVDWDGPDDPKNPMNWPLRRVVVVITIISIITFLSSLASSVLAPGILQVLDDFHSQNLELGSFVISVYVIGYALGPLIIAPLSEVYGRSPLYHGCGILFVLFSAACAMAPSLASLVVLRLFAGLAGSCPLALSAGTIADIVPFEKRGRVLSAWTFGPLLGPVIGPIAGGYLINVKGWRWSFWLVTIVSGAVWLVSFLFLRETYAYTLLWRKTKRLRKATGNPNLRPAVDDRRSPTEIVTLAIVRPTKMLTCSPIIFLLSLFMFVFYGYLYLVFTAMPQIFQTVYGFSTGAIGLTYIGLGIGSFIGVFISGATSDRTVQWLKKEADATPKPEHRLPLAVAGSVVVPIGIFWIGWTAETHQHWMLPIIGTAILSIGVTLAFMAVLAYLIDAYGTYAASAVAASIMLRSLGGALLPLAGGPMFVKLGFGWGCSLLAFIAIAMIPVPIVFFTHGERIRDKRFFGVVF